MAINERKLREDLDTFFDNILIHPSSDTEPRLHQDHLKVYHELSRLPNVKIVLDSDRNYKHSDTLSIYVNPAGSVVDNPNSGDRYTDHDYVKKQGGKVWELFVVLSDIGNYASHYWNKRWSVGTGEDRDCEVDFVLEDACLPIHVAETKNRILETVTNCGYVLIDNQIFNQEVDWLNSKLNLQDFSPNLFELVFGGYELYDEADI